jgi:AcrR family transcriptional regulator
MKMSMPSDRRTRKRLATRQSISTVATRLFIERGFDQVTVDEIAEAADVGRMTVFNHFPRKEDMFFDLDEEGREDIREALRKRDPAIAPLEALRLLAHRIVAERRPYIRFFEGSRRFIETIAASETLKARARAIRDELTDVVREGLAETVGRDHGDPDAHLAASLVLATWAVAFMEAHRIYRRNGDVEEAQNVFLDTVNRGTNGVKVATAMTPYA